MEPSRQGFEAVRHVKYKTDDENMIFLSLGVISKVQVSKKASLSPILVEQAGAYSKPLVMIEAQLLHINVHLAVKEIYKGDCVHVRVIFTYGWSDLLQLFAQCSNGTEPKTQYIH